jgi:hypothetical protein
MQPVVYADEEDGTRTFQIRPAPFRFTPLRPGRAGQLLGRVALGAALDVVLEAAAPSNRFVQRSRRVSEGRIRSPK